MKESGENTPETNDDDASADVGGQDGQVVELVDPKDAEIAALKARAQDTETKLRAVSKAYTDLEADNEGFRRRMTSLADQRAERRGADVLEQFFEPVRNLRRSLEATGDLQQVIDGLKMISAQFDDTMRRLGVLEIPALGQNFDPSVHEALMHQPVTDRDQDGKVITVYAVGYRLGTKVLQPAQVVVGKFVEGGEA